MGSWAHKYHATLWVIQVVLWGGAEENVREDKNRRSCKEQCGTCKTTKIPHEQRKKMFKIYLVTHSLKSGKVSWCVLMLWCIKTHLKSAQEILYYKYLLFNVHSCKKDSLYAVEWDSECQAGLQNSCRWCSFQSRLKPHWAHQNHQELEAFRRVVIFKKHNDEGVRISKKHSNLYFTT